MAIFISPSNFDAGVFRLAQDKYSSDDIQTYIDKYENFYLRIILGDKLYTDFVADLTSNVPNHPKYLALLNGATYTNSDGKFVIYDGLIESVKYFIWTEYVRRSNYINTIAGTVENQNENSTTITRGLISQLCRDAWNTGVPLANGTNYFVFNFDNYESIASSITFVSGTTYLVTIADTLYLADGDTVTINKIDYTVANLVDNVSFEIDSATSIVGTEVKVNYDVFGTYEQEIMEYSFMNK